MKLSIDNFVIALVILCVSWTAMAIPPATPTTDGPVDKTSDFIGYLNAVYQNKALDETQLHIFIKSLEKHRLVNPIHEGVPNSVAGFSGLEVNYARRGLQEYLDQYYRGEIYIRLDDVQAWAGNTLLEKKQTGAEQREVWGKPDLISESKMIFHRVKGGIFYMKIRYWNATHHIPFNLVLDFEMLSTQVKEWHWVVIMGTNPSSAFQNQSRKSIFPDLTDLEDPYEKWGLTTDTVRYELHRYLFGISNEMISEFLNRLNQLSQLDSPILHYLVDDFKLGDRFRIPYEHEWSYVVQGRGDFRGKFECEDSNLKYSSWAFDGKVFEGFDSEAFEWVDDGWNSSNYVADHSVLSWGDGRVHRIKGPLILGESRYGTPVLRRAWSALNRPSSSNVWDGNCRDTGYSMQNTEHSQFRLIRERNKSGFGENLK